MNDVRCAETVADQHDELVKDTRILQQACARHEKMFVRGDADKRRRENEFRVAVQQNEALKVSKPPPDPISQCLKLF